VANVDRKTEARRIDDYLRGRLSEEETRRFEIQLLEDEALFAKVQREALLQEGLRELPIEAGQTEPESMSRSSARRMSPLLRWLQPALTGALALAVVVLAFGNLGLRHQLDERLAPRPGIPVITLHDQRALFPGINDASTGPGDRDGPVLLEIDVSAYDEQEFRVEIQTTRDTYNYERIYPDARGYVTVYLPSGSSAVSVFNSQGTVVRRF